MALTSLEELYNKAVKEIKGQKGVIQVTIGGIPKTSNSNDIIGNCVQEWIPQWLEDNGLKLETNPHSQAFPDFTAMIDGKRYDMEVKCWNHDNAPAFDIANFDGFYREIYENPNKLFAHYLIFGYTPTKHGFTIQEIYLKRIWEITSPSTKYPLGVQVKQGKPYAIRPFAFHKGQQSKFTGLEDFVNAIYEARKIFGFDGRVDPAEWHKKVLSHIEE